MWIFSLIIFVFGGVLAFFNIQFSYWKRKEIPFYRGTSPWGSFTNIFKQGIEQQAEQFHKHFRTMRVKYGGIYLFTEPIFMPVNTELVRRILLKDSVQFSARRSCCYVNLKHENHGEHLYNTNGERWKKLSKKIKLILSAEKLKGLKPTLITAYFDTVSALNDFTMTDESVDLRQFALSTTRDVLLRTVFGMINADDYGWLEHRLHETTTARDVIVERFKWCLPRLAGYFNLPVSQNDAEDRFAKKLLDHIKKRHNCSIVHMDFLELFMDLHSHDHYIDFIPEDDKLTMYDIINHCLFFCSHAFQTGAKILSFALYELARNQSAQQRIRAEAMYYLHNDINKLMLIELSDLKYLQQVVKEVLRLYPPIKILERKCTKKFKLPHVEKYVERGTNVLISILGLHKDDYFYHNPEKFDPERFCERNCDKFEKQCVYLPFGEGLRACPGSSFTCYLVAQIHLKME